MNKTFAPKFRTVRGSMTPATLLRFSRICAALAVAAFAVAGPVPASFYGAGQAAAQASRENFPPDFTGVSAIRGWVLLGGPRTFSKQGLYGYIDGGAETFLQYGFRDLTVFEFVPEKTAAPSKKSITLEIYRMESPTAAFGIFSTKREGNEPVSGGIKTLHWLMPEQANLVKGDLYINILASGCTQAEVEDFVVSLAPQLPAADTGVPESFSCMPEFSLVPGTERYICGQAAAASESPLLGADFWGFKEGIAEAFSAKYLPGVTKVVLIHFNRPPEDLGGKVYQLFKEHFMSVTVLDDVLQGYTVVGRNFYFGQNGPNGVIILNEPDPKVARAYIKQALDKAAKQLEAKPKKTPDEKKK
jgi:hypothetical protein